jgi:hypothetical protein
MSSIYLNLESVSKPLPRSSIPKPSKLNQICLTLSIQSEYWILRKEAQEERPSGCLKFNGTITPKKKRLGKPSHISNTTFQTFLKPIHISNHPIPSCSGNLGTRFFLGGKAVTFRYLRDRHDKF